MLDVDQASELKAAFRRGNWTNSEIKRLCEGDILARMKQVICGYAEVVFTSILKFVSTVVVPATSTQFVAKDKFVVDTSATATVKISHLGEDFRTWYLGKTEEPLPEQVLRYAKLRKASLNTSIIAELGGEEKAETTLSELYLLMEEQKNGKDGPLLTSTYWWNIFYIKDVQGELRSVGVNWCSGGWDVGSVSVGSQSSWADVDQVFYRDSC